MYQAESLMLFYHELRCAKLAGAARRGGAAAKYPKFYQYFYTLMGTMILQISCIVILASSCATRDTTVDKSKLRENDYRLFQNTPAWVLTKAVEDADTDNIKDEIQKNKSLLNFREPVFGQSILELAVKNVNYNSTKVLLESGADPNIQDFYNGDSPLMAAADIGVNGTDADPRFLKLLIKFGGNPNTIEKGRQDSAGNTPLIIACKNSNLEYVKILVTAGANINFITESNDTALEAAAFSAGIIDNPDIAIYLIQNGADYKRPLLTRDNGEKYYITNAMREWRFDLGSDAYKKKMWLVAFLKKNGLDYRKTGIPEEFQNDYPKDYLERY